MWFFIDGMQNSRPPAAARTHKHFTETTSKWSSDHKELNTDIPKMLTDTGIWAQWRAPQGRWWATKNSCALYCSLKRNADFRTASQSEGASTLLFDGLQKFGKIWHRTAKFQLHFLEIHVPFYTETRMNEVMSVYIAKGLVETKS